MASRMTGETIRGTCPEPELYVASVRGLRIRALASMAFMVLAVVVYSQRLLNFTIAGVLAILIVDLLLYAPSRVLLKRSRHLRSYLSFRIALDILLITAGAHFLGGIEIPGIPLVYSLTVIFSGVLLDYRACFLTANGCLVAYATLVFLETHGVVAHHTVFNVHFTEGEKIALLGGDLVFLNMIALATSYFAGVIKDRDRRLDNAYRRIEKYNATLEERVAERTVELITARDTVEERNGQLSRAMADLRKKSSEIEDLVQIIAHDLKNCALSGKLQAAKLARTAAAKLSPKEGRYLLNLEEDNGRLAKMLAEVNSLHVIAGDKEPHQLIDIGGLISSCIERHHGAIEQKGVHLKFGDLPVIWGPPRKLEHVFANLIGNAVKYVGENDPPTVSIHAELEGNHLVIHIQDNGVGIPTKECEYVFRPFKRGSNQNVRGVEVEGTGMGLAFVRRIVEGEGGFVRVSSKVAVGSKFSVALPKDVLRPTGLGGARQPEV